MSVQDQTTTGTHGVVLTDVAAHKVKSLLEQEGREDLRLRVGVQPGGCSGLIYQLYFDERTLDGDAVRDFEGVEVVVDRMSAPYLHGRHDRLRRHHRAAGLHHRQPQRGQLLRLRRQLQLTCSIATAPDRSGPGPRLLLRSLTSSAESPVDVVMRHSYRHLWPLAGVCRGRPDRALG